MRISVALCTYNGEAYIEALLSSLGKQTRKPDEIVICDDCSTDGTIEKIKSFFKGKAIVHRLIENEKNLGFAQNFRKCVSLCEGDLIFLCDQDDVWNTTKIEELTGLMEEKPQILSMTSNFYLIDTQGQRITGNKKDGDNPFFNTRKYEIDEKEGCLYKISLSTILCRNIAPGCTQVIRKSIVKDFLLKNKVGAHDYEFNRIAGLRNGLYYYDKALTEYRYHESQTIGIPYYAIIKYTGGFSKRLIAYMQLFKEFVYLTLFSKDDRALDTFSVTHTFKDGAQLDEMTQQMQRQYRRWVKITTNRTILYNRGKLLMRLKAFVLQGRYNKFFLCKYAVFESIKTRLMDVLVLIKRR